MFWGLTYLSVPRFTLRHLGLRFSYEACSEEWGGKPKELPCQSHTVRAQNSFTSLGGPPTPPPRFLLKEDTVEGALPGTSGHLCSTLALLLVSGLTSPGFSFFLLSMNRDLFEEFGGSLSKN